MGTAVGDSGLIDIKHLKQILHRFLEYTHSPLVFLAGLDFFPIFILDNL